MIEDRRCWLITGGCGFIGTALIGSILEGTSDARIHLLDNLSVGTRKDLAKAIGSRSVSSEVEGNLSSEVELIVGDIRNSTLAREVCQGVDTIVHLAANTGVGPSVEDPVGDMESNVRGTLNMLDAARTHGVKRFVFASSGAPVGEVTPPIHEELAARPVSPYGASKLAGEGYCSAYFRSFGVETVALRFGNVYGPGSANKNSVVAKFIKHILAGEPLPIYGDGKQTRDFIYIQDIVQAIMLSAVRPGVGGEVFQIATHREHTVDEVAEALNLLAEKHVGYRCEIVYEQERKGDVRRNYSDISKAKRVLGFEPAWDLEKGLEETFMWFLRRE